MIDSESCGHCGNCWPCVAHERDQLRTDLAAARDEVREAYEEGWEDGRARMCDDDDWRTDWEKSDAKAIRDGGGLAATSDAEEEK